MIKHKYLFIAIEIFFMTYWLSAIINTDAYYITYFVTGILSFIALYRKYKNEKKGLSKKNNIIFLVVAGIYSLTVILANYNLLGSLLQKAFVIMGAFLAFYNILRYILAELDNYTIKTEENKNKTLKFFSICTTLIFVFNMIFLIFAYYPGVLTNDSITQLEQIFTGKYSNHHPYYHTFIIKIFVDIGMNLFNNINISIVMYNTFQVFLFSATISFCLTTLYQMKVDKKYIIMCLLFYVLMPYNLMYSFTIWKDILFSLNVLAFTVSLYRIMNHIGKKQWINYILIFLTSIGIMIFRTNGFGALLPTYLVMICIFKKENIKLLLIILISIIIALILKGPVLKVLNIQDVDFVESLSIPLQQVTRVIIDGNTISEKQYEEISKIIEVDTLEEKYKNYISDPIKNGIRNYGNQNYLVEHKMDYLKIYIEIGLKYPIEYIRAWADQTKGFWSGGYKYWIWSNKVEENDLGAERIVILNTLNNINNKYWSLFDSGNVFSLFVSIGFNTWILICLFVYNIINKKRESILFLPIIFLIGTLVIATPVFSEFRYIYAMFLVLPFLFFLSFWKGRIKT